MGIFCSTMDYNFLVLFKNWECCTSATPCSSPLSGDCDNDNECAGDLFCGNDNCGAGDPTGEQPNQPHPVSRIVVTLYISFVLVLKFQVTWTVATSSAASRTRSAPLTAWFVELTLSASLFQDFYNDQHHSYHI